MLSGTEELFVFITPQHESVYVVGGVFQTILVQHPGALGKAHTRQTVVLCHDNISQLYSVDQRKVHTVSTLVEYQRLRTFPLDLVGGVAQDDDRNAELLCNLQGQVNHGTAIRINQNRYACSSITHRKAPAVWGKESFGGNAADTLRFLTEQAIPTLKQQFALPENVRIILGGYSLAGLFALWASTQTALFSGVAAASPSVWFPGWMEFEQQHPIQAQRIYLSLGDREECTKNTIMAAVGDNIRALHHELVVCGKTCTLEWNRGGHFKDADLRTAKAFFWAMEDMR